jgi:hypothetical protein
MNNIETMQLRKEMILTEIERDQDALRVALRDLGSSVSLKEKVGDNHKTWLVSALLAGFLVGELI